MIQKLDFEQGGSSEFLAGARDVFVNTARSEDENYEGNPTQPGVPEDRLDLWGKAPDKSQFLSHERYVLLQPNK